MARSLEDMSLQCPVCSDTKLPPITLCVNRHGICGRCRPVLRKCPECDGRLTFDRAEKEDSASRIIHQPCPFKKWGCEERMPIDKFANHKKTCPFEHAKCPFSILQPPCKWEGLFDRLTRHVSKHHPRETRSVDLQTRSNYKAIICGLSDGTQWSETVLAHDEVFLHYSEIVGNLFFTSVIYCGPAKNEGKFKYNISMVTRDGKESVSMSLICPTLTDIINDFFDNVYIPSYPKRFLRRFRIKKDSLEMEMKITKMSD